MADSIQSKRDAQTYLRQVQQDKAQKKREIMQAQSDDIKAVREYYKDATAELEEDSAAAINHIRDESRQLAETERQERTDRIAEEAADKLAAREEAKANRSSEISESSVNGSEKKKLYTRQIQRSPLIQNYETKESDDFYHVQDRGSRISEGPNGYVIEAYAPEHEKDNLRVSIQSGKAVVSGQRKFADEAQQGNKKIRTNNYQSFREEFAFDRPVSEAGMKRERVGDYVRFTIPKLEATAAPEDDDIDTLA
jgi:HSP20 family molecular chaperone IbpA